MARKSPQLETLKLLYVRSGNECAFPGCEHPIFNDDGLYIAQLCHITAANEGGERFDKNQTDDERRAFENLLFMCHRHHKETDDVNKYPVEKLKEIKGNHESNFTEKGKEASKEMIRQIQNEANYFWKKQKAKTFDLADLKINRDFDKGLLDLLSELEGHIKTIENYCDLCADSDNTKTLKSDLKLLLNKAELDFASLEKVPYYENPFVNRNWEMHNIGRPNLFSHIALCLNQLKVKIAEELIKSDPKNTELTKLIEEYRLNFEETFNSSYYVD